MFPGGGGGRGKKKMGKNVLRPNHFLEKEQGGRQKGMAGGGKQRKLGGSVPTVSKGCVQTIRLRTKEGHRKGKKRRLSEKKSPKKKENETGGA